jgi:hypothetical protein
MVAYSSISFISEASRTVSILFDTSVRVLAWASRAVFLAGLSVPAASVAFFSASSLKAVARLLARSAMDRSAFSLCSFSTMRSSVFSFWARSDGVSVRPARV